jgi:hypothetical protein
LLSHEDKKTIKHHFSFADRRSNKTSKSKFEAFFTSVLLRKADWMNKILIFDESFIKTTYNSSLNAISFFACSIIILKFVTNQKTISLWKKCSSSRNVWKNCTNTNKSWLKDDRKQRMLKSNITIESILRWYLKRKTW